MFGRKKDPSYNQRNTVGPVSKLLTIAGLLYNDKVVFVFFYLITNLYLRDIIILRIIAVKHVLDDKSNCLPSQRKGFRTEIPFLEYTFSYVFKV